MTRVLATKRLSNENCFSEHDEVGYVGPNIGDAILETSFNANSTEWNWANMLVTITEAAFRVLGRNVAASLIRDKGLDYVFFNHCPLVIETMHIERNLEHY
jgi:hypothetical protein